MVLDHKLHVATRDVALVAAAAAAAQLEAYASLCSSAWAQTCGGLYVHLPAQGLLARVELLTPS